MAASDSTSDFVSFSGVPATQYGSIVAALGGAELAHRYQDEVLAIPGRLHRLPWRQYERFLDAVGDRPLRHTFDRGELEIMHPRKEHVIPKRVIGRMIEALAMELEVDIKSVGSMTLTSRRLERGIEPDETYYIANESRVRHKMTYDPEVDPPPDLAVEVDVTSSSIPRLPVFAALGVKEVWRRARGELQFLQLGHDGQYEAVAQSLSFPFLTSDDVNQFLDQWGELSENALIRAFCRHARQRYEQNAPPDAPRA